MATAADLVFLLDVDNTLLDNDRVQDDLRDHLEREFGAASRDRYWAIFEALRTELGYADYLGALQRYRMEDLSDTRLLLISSFLVDYPFASRLYPGSTRRHPPASVARIDGDFFRRGCRVSAAKIERSGLWTAVKRRVLILRPQGSGCLRTVEKRYPARHYVMVDDKLRILTAMKTAWNGD